MLERVKGEYVAKSAPVGITTGEIHAVCADLSVELWPIAPASVSAIVCIHFAMTELVPCLISSLRQGGYIYIETFGAHGQNYRQLPKAGELRALLDSHVEFGYYKERIVGPQGANTVTAKLFAQKR